MQVRAYHFTLEYKMHVLFTVKFSLLAEVLWQKQVAKFRKCMFTK